MAKLYGEIAAKSLLTLDKSFARANGQPLDASEVYYSLEAAKTYAAGAQAYIGQKIVVVENGVVTHYGIEDANGNLKELGSKPVGDNKSIAVAEDGTVSLKGVGSLVFERDILGEDGEPTGDKEAVQYQPLMTAAGLVWVEPSKTTVEGLATLIDALAVRVKALEDDRVTEEELAAAIKVEADRADAAEKALGERIDAIDFVDEDEMAAAIAAARELISAEIDEDVKVAKDRADAAYTLAESKVDASVYATDKKALEDEDAAIREIAEAAKARIDTFLDEEGVADVVDSLHDLKAELDKMADASDMVEALATKADLTYVNDELAKKQDVIPENTYDAYGSAAAAEEAAKGHADSVAATAKSEAIEAAASAAAGIYATQTAVNNLETALDGRLDVLEAINHELYATKEELTAHNTAAEAKYATKDELAPVAQDAANAKTAVGNLETRFDEIVAVGGEPNAINKIQVNGSELTIADKTVNIVVPTKASDLTDDTGFDARITAAQNAADAAQSTANDAKSKAEQAQSEVDALETEVGGIQTVVASHTASIGDHATRIGALEQADIAHATEYSTLSGIVSGHTEAIAKKAEQTAVDAVVAKASANEAAIKTINETTIPIVNAEIAKKADKTALSDYHTKSEITAITGSVAEGKTLVQMIADAQSNATYNDTEVRGLIQNNSNAINAIYNAGDAETPASGVLVNEIARVEGLVKAEETRAKGIEANHEGRIANMETFWAAADNPEGTIDKLAEIVAYIDADKSGALDMAADIKANADAIAAIYTVGEDDVAAGVLVDEIARVDGKIKDNADAIALINHVDNGILAQAKAYVDAEIAGIPTATAEALGLVKFDNATIKMNESNQLYVAKVSTDILEQGSQTLILNGGSATV